MADKFVDKQVLNNTISRHNMNKNTLAQTTINKYRDIKTQQNFIKKNNLAGLTLWGLEPNKIAQRQQLVQEGKRIILDNLQTQQFLKTQQQQQKDIKQQSQLNKKYAIEKAKDDNKQIRDNIILNRYATLGNVMKFENYIQDKQPKLAEPVIKELRTKALRQASANNQYSSIVNTRNMHKEFDKSTKAQYDMFARNLQNKQKTPTTTETTETRKNIDKLTKYVVGGILLRGLKNIINNNSNALWYSNVSSGSTTTGIANVVKEGLKGALSMYSTSSGMIGEKMNWERRQGQYALTGIDPSAGLLSLVGANITMSKEDVIQRINQRFGKGTKEGTAYAEMVGLGQNYKNANETTLDKTVGAISKTAENILKVLGGIAIVVGVKQGAKNLLSPGSKISNGVLGGATATSIATGISIAPATIATAGALLSNYGNKQEGKEIAKIANKTADFDYLSDDNIGGFYNPMALQEIYDKTHTQQNNNINNNNAKTDNTTINNTFNITATGFDELEYKMRKLVTDIYEEKSMQGYLANH